MRPGTPGFIGAKLREGREARGITGATLADLLGSSRQIVSQYENGEKSPSPNALQRISAVLNLPTQFFLRPAIEDSAGAIHFRSRMAATKSARTKARRRRHWLEQIVGFIVQHVDLPPVNFPPCDMPSDPKKISEEAIEQAAIDARRFWGLRDGPISDVTLLLENHGAIIVREPFDDTQLDAYSTWVSGLPFMVLSNDKDSAVRSRLDAAHELGHLILHRNVDEVRLEERKADFKLVEDQAYLFATCFLLPRATFATEVIVPTLDALLTIKPRWKVSVAAMLKATARYDLVSPEMATRLWISYGRRGWKKREPLDDEIPPENPRLLRLAFELALGEKVFSHDEVAQSLALPDNDIEVLIGLNPGTLAAPDPVVRVLTLPNRKARQIPRTDNDKPRDVINFPGENHARRRR